MVSASMGRGDLWAPANLCSGASAGGGVDCGPGALWLFHSEYHLHVAQAVSGRVRLWCVCADVPAVPRIGAALERAMGRAARRTRMALARRSRVFIPAVVAVAGMAGDAGRGTVMDPRCGRTPRADP